MSTFGSEARNLNSTYAPSERNPQRQAHAPFEVVEGGGLDAQARRGVSPTFLARFKLAMAIGLALVAIGLGRVALTAATVSNMTESQSLESDLEAAQSENSNLKIERSVLSASSRIELIATENYGMVRSTSTDTITVDDSSDNGESSSDSSSSKSSVKDAQSSDADGTSSPEA